jgi:hypothetical protein
MLISRLSEERVVPRHYTDKELHERGLLIPHCGNCKHHDGFFRCAAYPEGIPFAIRSGGLAHIDALPNDNDIQYEPREYSWQTSFSTCRARC